ncbi:hypothetical protein A1O1_05721 [Capronia coronata CBS 617.96]|uniref:Biogenesis of lysosome-related organelles complex 1 subunit 1 n=1 Tax=Capronia coronata CBS 617.96 TaxID=1182541 RepID=W9XXX4_9EURO|nr:uncharacterized protein A1O1_05721 [Capronia coronata CBS 617.96]EXJ85357.1 hypothetical protein A1O1_05721 [Capronia coronata CBS 617.96]
MSVTSQSVASLSSQMSPVSSTQRTAEAKDAFKAALTSVGASIDAELQARAKNIHANAKALTKQEDGLRQETKAVTKENDSIQKLLDQTSKEVQDFSEIDRLLADLDGELGMIELTLQLAEESDEGSPQESNNRQDVTN